MNADGKTCPRCAETVQAAAVVCRYCGTNLAPKVTVHWVVVAFVGLCLVASVKNCSSNPESPAPPIERPAPLLSAEIRSECKLEIGKATLRGIVKSRPAPNRVNVEEFRWRALPATDKEALLALVACDSYGKKPGELTPLSDYIVAYGHRSGKRLAMLTSIGMSFE